MSSAKLLLLLALVCTITGTISEAGTTGQKNQSSPPEQLVGSQPTDTARSSSSDARTPFINSQIIDGLRHNSQAGSNETPQGATEEESCSTPPSSPPSPVKGQVKYPESSSGEHTFHHHCTIPPEDIRQVLSKYKSKQMQPAGKGTYDDIHKIDINGGMYIIKTPSCKVPKKKGKSQKHSASKLLGYYHKKEFDILRSVDHSNIVRLLAFACTDHPFLDTCYLLILEDAGRDLFCLLRHEKQWVKENSFVIIRQTCAALSYLHDEKELVWGDLKDQNIVIDTHNRAVKFIDFSTCQGVADFQNPDYVAPGTPGWMAPEVFRKKHGATTKSDIFSLGILIVDILLVPDWGQHAIDNFEQYREREPERICTLLHYLLNKHHLCELRERLVHWNQSKLPETSQMRALPTRIACLEIIAVLCTRKHKDIRPCISKVKEWLEIHNTL